MSGWRSGANTLWCAVVEPFFLWILLYYTIPLRILFFFFFQAEDGIRDYKVTEVQTCALPISKPGYEFPKVCAAPRDRRRDPRDSPRPARRCSRVGVKRSGSGVFLEGGLSSGDRKSVV